MSDPPAAATVDSSVIDKIELTDKAVNSAMLQTLSENPHFVVTWTNRRRIINYSLLFVAGVITVLVLMCGLCLALNRDVPANITSLFITLITSVVFFALAIIGSYVFGAVWEANNFRDKISDLASTVVKRGSS